jgi:hypothetical protein
MPLFTHRPTNLQQSHTPFSFNFALSAGYILQRSFRNRSERDVDHPDQLCLDVGDTDVAEDPALGLAEALEDRELTISEHRRRKSRKKRDERLPDHLPGYEVPEPRRLGPTYSYNQSSFLGETHVPIHRHALGARQYSEIAAKRKSVRKRTKP